MTIISHIHIVISDLPLQVLIDPGLGPAVCRVPVVSHVLLPGQVPDTVTSQSGLSLSTKCERYRLQHCIDFGCVCTKMRMSPCYVCYLLSRSLFIRDDRSDHNRSRQTTRYLNIATDSVRAKSPSRRTGTFWKGFIAVYSGVFVSPAVILTFTNSWGMAAALQNIATARAG